MKNALNILIENVIDACVAELVFYLVGYGVAYGKNEDGTGNGFIGTGDFALSETGKTGAWHNWFFQWAFAAAAATIVSGSVAERCRFEAYFAYSSMITAFVYHVVVHWFVSPCSCHCLRS
jgi:ammonium transporter, Amt family